MLMWEPGGRSRPPARLWWRGCCRPSSFSSWRSNQGRARTQTSSVLYSFAGGTDGAAPSGVTFDHAGNLYGTASEGGLVEADCPSGCGTVFKLTNRGPGWNLNILYRFRGGDDSSFPRGLIFGPRGKLYGLATVPHSSWSLPPPFAGRHCAVGQKNRFIASAATTNTRSEPSPSIKRAISSGHHGCRQIQRRLGV